VIDVDTSMWGRGGRFRGFAAARSEIWELGVRRTEEDLRPVVTSEFRFREVQCELRGSGIKWADAAVRHTISNERP
jgi:hypothetical protein